MNIREAEINVDKLINTSTAQEYAEQTDKMLWVEHNIMIPSGIASSINTKFGEYICNYIEDKLTSLI